MKKASETTIILTRAAITSAIERDGLKAYELAEFWLCALAGSLAGLGGSPHQIRDTIFNAVETTMEATNEVAAEGNPSGKRE